MMGVEIMTEDQSMKFIEREKNIDMSLAFCLFKNTCILASVSLLLLYNIFLVAIA